MPGFFKFTGTFFLNLESLKILQKYNFKDSVSILAHGDIEPNPGWSGGLRLIHWNLNSIKKDNFSRVSLAEAHLRQHDIHIAAFTESKLSKCDSCKNGDCHNCKKLNIRDYCLVRSDLTGLDTHGGICIYYRETLPVIRLPQANHVSDLDLPSYTICLQIRAENKKIFLLASYRKFGQTTEQSDQYYKKLRSSLSRLEMENPHMIVVMGDFTMKNGM